MEGAKKKGLPALLTLRLKSFLSLRASRTALFFAYGFTTAFMLFTFFLAHFNPAWDPFSFSFSSSTTTAPLSSTSSSLFSSSFYALPDPNVGASENGAFTGNATNVVKRDLEAEISPDSVSYMTSSPEKSKVQCDIFDGRWVWDDSYPHYPAGTCPYVETATNCYQNGRPERNYEKWRWQPNGCNIPRLDPKDMLERLRGKRLAFVGDSLNRNMWRSLICLLWSSLEDKTRIVRVSGLRELGTSKATVFRFLDYQCTLEFFWSAFLADEQQISLPNGTIRKKLRLDNIATFAPSYKDADILIFNSGHWWVPAKTNNGKDFYELGNRMYGYLEGERAYLRALMTWAEWVDANVNPNKTTVFFRAFSNVHYSGGQWNSGGHCHNEAEPIMNDAYLSPQPRKMKSAESVIRKMRTPVTCLNITKLSDYRKDAHPSIYTSPKTVPKKFQDCSHWCLPGIPDTWNELLYAILIMKTKLDQAD